MDGVRLHELQDCVASQVRRHDQRLPLHHGLDGAGHVEAAQNGPADVAIGQRSDQSAVIGGHEHDLQARLVQVADRVLKFDSQKAPTVLGIKSPKKSWLKAAPLIREWEERKENPESTDLARYWGVHDQEMEIFDLQDELMMYMEIAEEKGITRLEAREKVAAERGYSSESSHRRGVNRRLKRSQE